MKVPYRNPGMTAPNDSTVNYDTFILIGLPGLKKLHTWIPIPFCLMYLVAVPTNAVLICVVAVERVYLFLSMLAFWDLILSTATFPKALSIF